MSDHAPDPGLLTARAAALSGAWGEVRSSLEQDMIVTARDGVRSMLLGEAYLRTGDPRSASRWLDTASPLLDRAGDRPSRRKVVNMQGAAAFSLGALDIAAERFGEALALSLRDDDALLTARATNNLGAIAALHGSADGAIASYQLAIPAYQRLGNQRGLAESWHNLAIAYRMRGDLNAADDAERRAIEFATEAADVRLTAMAQVGRAEIALRRGDPLWSRATLSRALLIFSQLPDFLLEADALWLFADACDQAGLQAESDAALDRSLTLARGHGHRLQEAQALQTQAQILARRGEIARALAIGMQAREAFSQLGSVVAADEMAEFLAGLAR